ncbi:G patch domain-containing protein 11 [Vanrija pseudolonga]|uniref:G patch domain-containing protein 11 n=1 Tax=Vanrija pseudolonga TaxID=143232 RepID=A0AAF0YCW8_9TREE|nr:G patch domain-containing protein 11 [Vanrija pseudolonga]
MSDSEDDFMSDKFLVEAPTANKTYSQRRSHAALKAERKVRADNAAPRREEEAARRHAGLNTSLFDTPAQPEAGGSGQAKAMGLMMKMGWKVGEGLGRRRSASPERAPKAAAYDDDAPRAGLGARQADTAGGRAEPIRISMWAGRKGLAARSPSPPPLLNPRRTNPDYLAPERHAALAADADAFRGRRGADSAAKKAERDAGKARALLQEMDEARGVKFHPLWAQPGNPAALPRELLRLIYPDEVSSRSASEELEEVPLPVPVAASARENNMSAAERLRAQMRRDMLSDLGGGEGEDEDIRFGVAPPKDDDEDKPAPAGADEAEIDWPSLVSGTKRVLSLTPQEHLAFLVSQLRTEHLFCFWCGSKYASFEEMDGPGGCPGEDEDDH